MVGGGPNCVWLWVGGRRVGDILALSNPWLQARCILGKSRQNPYRQIQNEIPIVEGIAVLSTLSTRPMEDPYHNN